MSKAFQNQQKKKQKLSDKFLNRIYQNEKEIYRKAKIYCLKL